MAERKDEDTSSDAVANRVRGGNELQAADSPSAAEPVLGKIPAEPVAATVSETDSSAAVASEKEAAPAPTPEILAPAPSSLVLRPRHARHAPVAASVAIAAALGAMAVGAVVGAATTGGFSHTVPASATPIPTSRPAAADAETNLPARVSVLADWSIRGSRNGYVYVKGHGDIYQVVPGAPLPGLGPVEQIKRQDGRWVVVTPKGIIVSTRDRRHFERL